MAYRNGKHNNQFNFHNNHHHHSINNRIHNYDRLAVGILSFLFILYTVVTVYTYTSVTTGARNTAVISTSSSSSSTTTTSSTTTSQQQNQRENQQQQQQQNNNNIDGNIIKLQHTFPIHVGSDTITIIHPAIELLELFEKQSQQLQKQKSIKRRQLPSDITRTLTVPLFFDESHGYIYNNNNSTIRQFLNNGQSLLSYDQASKIGSYYSDSTINDNTNTINDLETIYCSIASYRDPECAGSLEDLYSRAKYPNRIRVAIIDQRLPDSDDSICKNPIELCTVNPNQALCKYQHLIDYYEMDSRLAVGPVFARHLAHRHYRGEYYAMQIDSHVRFTEHWDVDIINQFKSANNEMAVLTTYLSDITNSIDPITHKNIHHGRPILCASDYEGAGQYKHLRHGQQPEGEPGIKGQPTLDPFWAAGFSFARGHFVIQVPYDQYLPMVFQGEEISIGLRGFTYGYDYYAPERSVCFHMYAIRENEAKRKAIPMFWENSDMYTGVGMMAMRRLNSIIGMVPKNVKYVRNIDWIPIDESKYGLGSVRNTSKFFTVFGIHTDTESVEHHLCRFVGKPMMKLFLPSLRLNKMGLDYNKINYQFIDEWKNEKD